MIYLICEKTSGHISNMIALAYQIKHKYNLKFIISGTDHEINTMKKIEFEYDIFNNNLLNINKKLNIDKPKYIISSGGRFSFLIITLAKSKNIPTLILEPNYYPGLGSVLMSPDSKVLTPHLRYSNLYNCKCIKFLNPI